MRDKLQQLFQCDQDADLTARIAQWIRAGQPNLPEWAALNEATRQAWANAGDIVQAERAIMLAEALRAAPLDARGVSSNAPVGQAVPIDAIEALDAHADDAQMDDAEEARLQSGLDLVSSKIKGAHGHH